MTQSLLCMCLCVCVWVCVHICVKCVTNVAIAMRLDDMAVRKLENGIFGSCSV